MFDRRFNRMGRHNKVFSGDAQKDSVKERQPDEDDLTERLTAG